MRSSVASAAGLLLAVALAVPAAAHTTLVFASPGPGQRAAGTVDRIELGFADPVFDPVVKLFAPDGTLVEGRVEIIDDRTIAHISEGLEMVGEYVVSYKVTAPDDDDQPDLEGAYAFTYAAGGRSGSNWPYLAGVVVVLSAIGGYAAWRVSKIPPRDPNAVSD